MCMCAEADKQALEERKAEVEASIAAAKQEVPRAQRKAAEAQATALALAAEVCSMLALHPAPQLLVPCMLTTVSTACS